ncbi:MAG: hypothetical protein WC955_11850 [Elusimicrobiota bacterium]
MRKSTHKHKRKGGDNFMKKVLGLLLGLAVIVAFAGTSGVFAADPDTDSAYIVVKCVAVVSVDIVGAAAAFSGTTEGAPQVDLGEVSPGEVVHSSAAVSVINDSQGAITKWKVKVGAVYASADGINDWAADSGIHAWTTDGAAAGSNKFLVKSIFTAARNTEFALDFGAGDIVTTSDQTYMETTGVFGPQLSSAYGTAVDDGDPSSNWVNPKYTVGTTESGLSNHTRSLWLEFTAPLAISNASYRAITVSVTATQS